MQNYIINIGINYFITEDRLLSIDYFYCLRANEICVKYNISKLKFNRVRTSCAWSLDNYSK